MGMMVERLKHERTSHRSSDLLKICVKMGASWPAQDFRQTCQGAGLIWVCLCRVPVCLSTWLSVGMCLSCALLLPRPSCYLIILLGLTPVLDH